MKGIGLLLGVDEGVVDEMGIDVDHGECAASPSTAVSLPGSVMACSRRVLDAQREERSSLFEVG